MTVRPLYENDQSLSAEAEIANACAYCWGWEARKLSIAYGPDYALIRDGVPRPTVRMFLEAKDRNWTFGNGDGYWLSALKARSCWSLWQSTGIPVRLAVRFNDGVIRWTRMNLFTNTIWTGRHDRDDQFDVEPHVVFDWIVFEELRP